VRLKNGGELEDSLVIVLMNTLRDLGRTIPGITARWDLVRVCRDHTFVITDNSSRELLVERNLVRAFDEDGQADVFDAVRDVVQSAAVGDGLNLKFQDPSA
jgi:hypothetical protein